MYMIQMQAAAQALAWCALCTTRHAGLALTRLLCMYLQHCFSQYGVKWPTGTHLVYIISTAIYPVPPLKTSAIEVGLDRILLTAAGCSSLCSASALQHALCAACCNTYR